MKAIQTFYDGRLYRSRSEARYAVLMDRLGVAFDYEPEGYVLSGVPYLPDFWVKPKDRARGFFIEVKGDLPTEDERHKADLLCVASRKPVFIVYGGIPLPPQFDNGSAELHLRSSLDGLAVTDTGYHWTECPVCGCIDMAWAGNVDRTGHEEGCLGCERGGRGDDSETIRRAHVAARQARFEHGETPIGERLLGGILARSPS